MVPLERFRLLMLVVIVNIIKENVGWREGEYLGNEIEKGRKRERVSGLKNRFKGIFCFEFRGRIISLSSPLFLFDNVNNSFPIFLSSMNFPISSIPTPALNI